MPDDRPSASQYEQDLDAWAMGQASALRAASRGELSGDDLLRTLDWDNLAEEIEGLARKDRRELASRLALIVEHLAKLEFSPAAAPREGWEDTVSRERDEVEAILDDSPSLRGLLPRFLTDRTARAIDRAAKSLIFHGESQAAANLRLSRSGAGYSLDEVLGAWLPDRSTP